MAVQQRDSSEFLDLHYRITVVIDVSDYPERLLRVD